MQKDDAGGLTEKLLQWALAAGGAASGFPVPMHGLIIAQFDGVQLEGEETEMKEGGPKIERQLDIFSGKNWQIKSTDRRT